MDQRLLHHALFEGTRQELITPVLRLVKPRLLEAGFRLQTPETKPPALHLVLEGRLRAFELTADGSEFFLDSIEAGGFDGILPLFGKRGHFIGTETRAVVASVPQALVERLIEAEPRVALNLLRLAIARLSKWEGRIVLLGLRNPTQRLAIQLLRHCESSGRSEADGKVLARRLTHQTLADMLGLRRETVTLHLNFLKQARAVEVTRRDFLLDRKALERIIERGIATPLPNITRDLPS